MREEFKNNDPKEPNNGGGRGFVNPDGESNNNYNKKHDEPKSNLSFYIMLAIVSAIIIFAIVKQS